MNNNKIKIYNIAIVGGGASGMMAGLIASQNTDSIILIEKNPELGRKILATGNGRCNLTNKNTNKSYYHGGDSDFIEKVLNQFDQSKTMRFFEDLGLFLKEENLGRIFPRSDEASSVVEALRYELQKNHVEMVLGNQVRKLAQEGETHLFEILLQNNHKIYAKKLILTTGGQSAAHLGTTGDAYFWLKSLGHSITPLYPALTPLETAEIWPKELQGLKIEAKVTTTIDNKPIFKKTGDLLFTHFGVSGPAAMAQAGSFSPFLGKNEIKIHLDLFPNEDAKQIDQILQNFINGNGAKQIKNTLSGLIPSRLAPVLLSNLNINPDKKSAEVSKSDRISLSHYLKDIDLTITNTKSFKEAQVTHGGVNLDEVNATTLESKIVPNLYLAGEVLDVDGDSGGFNLQWAWSSGHLAGKSISK